MIVVGLAGPYGSGKGEVLAFLRDRSFACRSLSDVIRAELKKRNLSETRERMIRVGNEIREAEGPGALARRVLSTMARDRNYVIDSIRHPVEVDVLRNADIGFRLLWVDAPENVRLERVLRRKRAGDPRTTESLREFEARERTARTESAQNLDAVRELSDGTITNDGTVEDLHERVRQFLQTTIYFERPGWDAYFMNIARVVATRSNCVKRKVAAIITLDRRIVSTGYNGTPRGLRNCNEGGCPRCSDFAPGGTSLEECLCSHAEENAITQAAFHGVSVRGGALYTTYSPCLTCTKLIINSGLSDVIFGEDYSLGHRAQAILEEAGVVLRRADSSRS